MAKVIKVEKTKEKKKRQSNNSLSNVKTAKNKKAKTTIKKEPKYNPSLQLLLEEIKTISSTQKAELIRPMIPIEEWIDSSYYVGDLVYTLYPKYKQHIKSIFDAERDESDYIDEIIMSCSIGTGKRYADYTILPTPTGDKKLGDIKVNDYVFDENGNPVKVLGVYKEKEVEIYRVHFNGGAYIDCCADHLWTIYDHVHKYPITASTGYIKDCYENNINIFTRNKTKRKDKVYIQLCKPINVSLYEPKCNPYVIGALLADGYLKSGGLCWSKKEQNVVDEMSKYCTLSLHKGTTQYNLYKNENKIIWDALTYYNLWDKKSADKFIPEELFYTSIENRILLLQGLMDGDGSPRRRGNYRPNNTLFTYSTRSKQLALDVERLATSLGFNTHLKVIDDSRGSNREYYIYEVVFRPTFNPFKASAFSEYYNRTIKEKRIQDRFRRSIVSIEILNKKTDMTCLSVDSPTHLFIADKQYHIVTHNTSFINVVLLRKLYELSCYNDIRPLYNLMTSKKLLMVYFSITKEVAENTGYAQLRNMILSIPYFRDYFLPNTKKSHDIEWVERSMAITSGSNANQVIGTDVIASVIDEGDFYGTTSNTVDGQALSKAQSLYSSIRARARSRFLVNGINHSLNCIISSPTYASGFISKLMQENRSNPHAYIIEETLWTVKPKGTYSDQMFVVFKGSNLLDPQIVESTNLYNDLLVSLYYKPMDFKGLDVNKALKELPKEVQQYFVEVPIDFLSDFKINLIKSLQDIASVAVAPEGRLFTSEKYYQKAIIEDNPLMQDEIVISTNINDSRTIQSYFKADYKPKHPELPRFLHFDQSTTGDEAGVACCYIETRINQDRTIEKKVTVEWVVRIKPPKKPEQIDLKKLRSIVYYLRDNLHLRIGKVTFDSYASEEAVQDLKIHNIPCETLSLDRDDKAYNTVIQMYYTETLKHPEHRRYHEELFNLIWYREKHKVDHPLKFDNDAKGDKGVTDALVGAVYNAVLDADSVYNNLRANDNNVVLGIM